MTHRHSPEAFERRKEQRRQRKRQTIRKELYYTELLELQIEAEERKDDKNDFMITLNEKPGNRRVLDFPSWKAYISEQAEAKK
jgi:hypothetical protein